MAITDIGSYVTTGEEFKSHWTDVNADRVAGGGTALVLAGGYSLATLTTDVASVATAITSQEDLDNAIALATTARDVRKRTLRERLIEFRDAAAYRLAGSGYVRALPDTPHPDASEQKTLKALDDMASLWVRINADMGVPNFTPPLVLRAAFALAGFQTELATLRTNYKAVTDAENDARIGRGQRDVRLEPLRDRCVQYRQAIGVEYGPLHPFVVSLPDVYPQPGSTPEAVTLGGTWNVATARAEFSWPASTEPDLAEYELRMSVGAAYDAGTASVIGNAPPGTTSFSTTAGLAASGDVASFKLFVRLATGNAAGSNTITITRP
jgi:hypothetical protein